MQVWNVLHTARWKYRTQKWCKKSPSAHHCTTLLGCIFATKARIDNQNKKKFVKQQYLHMSSQYGELRPTNSWDLLTSLGHPANFNGFHVLAASLHGTPVVGVSQTLWHWTDGTTYIWQGGHHVGNWPTFLVYYYNKSLCNTLCKMNTKELWKQCWPVFFSFLNFISFTWICLLLHFYMPTLVK